MSPSPLSRLLLMLAFAGASCQYLRAEEWKSLFDGKSLQGWREAGFARSGKVRVENGALMLDTGTPLTGANYTGPLPQTDYEVRFDAARLKGSDFFASLTFPVGDSFCTLVTGGWGGDIVGLSNIDGWDASDNETRTYFTFETGRWYAFRLRVTLARITAWIDGKSVVDVEIGGRRIDLRPGPIEKSAPFGFAAYSTAASIRKIELRQLRPPGGGRNGE